MPRATNSVARHSRKKRLMKRAKGMVLARSKQLKVVKETVRRADAYAWRDRRARKRDFRGLWITRISAACRQRGVSYSRFIAGLVKAQIEVNRKMLSEVAIHDPAAFDALVEESGKALVA
ncbi:MAG: 50S ribosomal protein L20 [Planctomycetes bacterium]|nr:50S ribosomal protein L20 [Planctomycetota bacterium]